MLQAAFPNCKCSCQDEEGNFSSCRTSKGSHRCGRKELSRARSTEHLHCSHSLQEVIPLLALEQVSTGWGR